MVAKDTTFRTPSRTFLASLMTSYEVVLDKKLKISQPIGGHACSHLRILKSVRKDTTLLQDPERNIWLLGMQQV
jgi:riboflavin synthase alpha subunit